MNEQAQQTREPLAVSAGGYTIQVEGVDYHRNGVAGEGFYVVAFRWAQQWRDGSKDESRAMLGIVFHQDLDAYRVAVLDREQARRGNIFMHREPGREETTGGNAWRGDHFLPVLVHAIREESRRRDIDRGMTPYDPFAEQVGKVSWLQAWTPEADTGAPAEEAR